MWRESDSIPFLLDHSKYKTKNYLSDDFDPNQIYSFDWEFLDAIDPISLKFSKDSSLLKKISRRFVRSTIISVDSPDRVIKLLQILQIIIIYLSRSQKEKNKKIQKLQTESRSFQHQYTNSKKYIAVHKCPICFHAFQSIQHLDQHIFSKHPEVSHLWGKIRTPHPSKKHIDSTTNSKTTIQHAINQCKHQIMKDYKSSEKEMFQWIKKKLNKVETQIENLSQKQNKINSKQFPSVMEIMPSDDSEFELTKYKNSQTQTIVDISQTEKSNSSIKRVQQKQNVSQVKTKAKQNKNIENPQNETSVHSLSENEFNKKQSNKTNTKRYLPNISKDKQQTKPNNVSKDISSEAKQQYESSVHSLNKPNAKRYITALPKPNNINKDISSEAKQLYESSVHSFDKIQNSVNSFHDENFANDKSEVSVHSLHDDFPSQEKPISNYDMYDFNRFYEEEDFEDYYQQYLRENEIKPSDKMGDQSIGKENDSNEMNEQFYADSTELKNDENVSKILPEKSKFHQSIYDDVNELLNESFDDFY